MAQADTGMKRMRDLLTAAVAAIGIKPASVDLRDGALVIATAGVTVQPSAVMPGAWSVFQRYEVSDVSGGPIRFVSHTLVAAAEPAAAARAAALMIAEHRIDAMIDARIDAQF